MTAEIFTLIPKVMADIGFVAKTKKNEIQGYMFRGIDDLYRAAHQALVKHQVFCCPQIVEYQSEDRLMKNGTPAVRVVLKISHRFYAPDGSSIEVITMGEGIDTSDKSCNKAMSAAMKYAFIELFSIPTEDIEDSDRTTPESERALKPSEIAEPVTLTRPAKEPESRKAVETAAVATTLLVSDAPSAPAPGVSDNGDEPQYITTKQRQYLARRFRESVKKELEPRADELRHAALFAMQESGLFKSQFIDSDGNPTQDLILVSEYESIGRSLVKAAKSL